MVPVSVQCLLAEKVRNGVMRSGDRLGCLIHSSISFSQHSYSSPKVQEEMASTITSIDLCDTLTFQKAEESCEDPSRGGAVGTCGEGVHDFADGEEVHVLDLSTSLFAI